MLNVRYGKAKKGQPPRRRNVVTVMDWAAEAAQDYIENVEIKSPATRWTGPAGLLSKMLGVHISVAVAWQRASGGDWMGYAAAVAARSAIRAGSRTTDAPSA